MMRVDARGNAVIVATTVDLRDIFDREHARQRLRASPSRPARDPSGTVSVTALWWRERASRLAGVPSATMRPRSMITARVHTASTSSRRWVEMMIAFSLAIAWISLRTLCFWLGSRPSVGSSITSIGGSCRIAWARPTRRLKPLDSVSIGCSSTGSSSVFAAASAARALASAPREAAHLGDEVEELLGRHVAIGGRAFGQIAEHRLRRDGVVLDVVAADRHPARARA